MCRNSETNLFYGLQGRTLVMEMVEPDEQMCELVQQNDRIGMGRYWRSFASDRFDDPILEGKTAMECAIYKAQLGEIDPRDIEVHLETFETVERHRLRMKVR